MIESRVLLLTDRTAIRLLLSNASKHRHAHSDQWESSGLTAVIEVLSMLAMHAQDLIWEISVLAQLIMALAQIGQDFVGASSNLH